jgi:hypothetical protein
MIQSRLAATENCLSCSSATATARLARKPPIGFDEFYAFFAVLHFWYRTNYVELGYILFALELIL